MQNSNSNAGAKAEQSTNAEVTTSSPTIGNTNVGCCTSKETVMQRLINYMRSNFHLTDSTEVEFVKALHEEKQQIVDAYSEGFGCCYFSIDKSAEEYFNNTFKK